MKNLAIALCVFALLGAAVAQDNPLNLYAAGVSFNQGASPQVAGTALYARRVNDNSGTYVFSVFDALPANSHPFTVTTNVGAGIAQKLFSVGKVNFYAPTAAGVSFSGSNTGWQWNTGLAACIPVKGNWKILPNLRVVKSSVAGEAGYQPVAGILIGWGQ